MNLLLQEIEYLKVEIDQAHDYILTLEDEKSRLDDPWDREIVDRTIKDEMDQIESLKYRLQILQEEIHDQENN